MITVLLSCFNVSCTPMSTDTLTISGSYKEFVLSTSGGGMFKINHKRMGIFNKAERHKEFIMGD